MQNQPLLDVLTREGVLISVSVRYWRAAKKLKPEDLGLDPDDITDRLISLGHKKLLPREALAPFAIIESRAHALIEACAFPFLNGLAHYLPNTKLEEVTGNDREALAKLVVGRVQSAYTVKESVEVPEALGALERYVIINAIDHHWQEHLTEMEELRRSIGLRGYVCHGSPWCDDGSRLPLL